MRLFIAINLSDQMKDSLCAVQDRFRKGRVSGNYTPRENFHLTLAFIGEYNDPDRILDLIAGVEFDPFDITLDRLGAFDDLWWAGIAPCASLDSYVRRLRRALADGGIPFDRKRFSPHVTLIRRAIPAVLPPTEIAACQMTVKHISLMRSDRGRHGMIYTEII